MRGNRLLAALRCAAGEEARHDVRRRSTLDTQDLLPFTIYRLISGVIMSSCPDCSKDTLVTDLVKNRLVLVCSACGIVVNPNSSESESTRLADVDDCDDDFDSNGVETVEPENAAEHNVQSKTNVKKSSRHLVDTDVYSSAEGTAGSSSSSSSVQTCKACGGQNLIHDTIHETDQLVCKDCGYFAEVQELVFSHDYTAIPGKSDSAYQWTRAPKPKFANDVPYITKGKASGIKAVRDVSSHLSLRSDLTDQAIALYERLYLHETVKFASIDMKDTLGVCCAYCIARENGVKVTLKTLSGLLQFKKKWFTRSLRLIKAVREKPLSHQTVSSLHEHILSGGNFSLGLMGKVSKLVDVCEKGFVTQGRDHTNVVVGVAYLAWISEDIAGRKMVTLLKFCSQHHLPYTRNCQRVKNEVQQLLTTLACRLPWCRTPVEKDNVFHYLDSIIKFSQTVLNLASKKGQGFSTTSQTHDIDSDTCQSPTGSSTSRGCQALPALAPPSMRKRRCSVRIESSQLHLPSNLSSADLDNSNLCETEFEPEISSYLLSPEEVQLKEALLKL